MHFQKSTLTLLRQNNALFFTNTLCKHGFSKAMYASMAVIKQTCF